MTGTEAVTGAGTGSGKEASTETDAPAPVVADGVLRPHPGRPGRAEAHLAAPAVQNHAANLTVLPGGALGCVWFAGTLEGVSDISVWFSRLAPGADAWSDPVQLSEDPGRSEQNPLLFPAPSGDLWLLHTAQLGGRQETAEVRLRVSADGGVTWGPTRTLIEGGVFVRQPVTELPETGRLLLPVFRCVAPPDAPWTGDRDTSSVMISDDGGTTWQEHPVPGSTGLVHMNIRPLPDGSLLALFRSRRADAVHRSVSYDDGETWSEPEPLALPNNNSSIQYAVLSDGRLALTYNHSSAADAVARRVSLYDDIEDEGTDEQQGEQKGEQKAAAEPSGDAFWGAPRAPLSLAVSSDGGRTWPQRHDLETGDGHCLTNNSRDGLNRELSYPSITQTPDGTLHIAYTHHRRTIQYVRLSPQWTDREFPA
ncbi:sialidase family protein [Streptomyces acidicola]|uniref:Glycosyl hydrolase n=1 Tax=Streptomyces acidicola TaxID=2596892 RepID=A0A5N8WNF9_9ACTN|nr:exo-alpha-sialidase [Streptomyces acidicola]MPY48973.1 glycosyl hydrolase [Streptomyces acidicola]